MSQQKKVEVLFIWEPRKELKKYLKEGLAQCPVKLHFPKSPDDSYLEVAPDADIIVGWRPTKHLLEKAQNLSLFINPGAGVQHLIDLFREVNKYRSVVLINGHGNAYFTAQHAVGLLLALTNKIIPHHNWMVQGKWRKRDQDAISLPLRLKKIGLLGYGHVNKNIHRFLSGFELEFCILRRTWSKQGETIPTPVTKYLYTDLHLFLRDIDILIIAVPLTSLTKGLIKERELTLLGSSGLLVNVARGLVVDEYSLYTALKTRTIAGAAVDVWYTYNPDPDEKGRKYPFTYPFYELDNIILSPHRAASPLNDLKRWDEVIENIIRFSQGKTEFLNVVDLEREY